MALSFNSYATVYKEFQINGDTWVIKTDTDDDLIYLCIQTPSVCKVTGVGILHDYYTQRQRGDSARTFYVWFIDKANEKIKQYYEPVSVVPSEGDFNAFLDYLIKEGTEYDPSTNSFSITK